MRFLNYICTLTVLCTAPIAMAGLTLADAQKQAYLLDPALQNLNRLLSSSALKIRQSGRLDNPEIAIAIDSLGNSDLKGLDGPSFAVELSQSFPLTNKRNLRVDYAKAQHNSLQLAIGQRQAYLNAEVRLCIAELQAAQQRTTIALNDSDIAQSQAQLVQAKYRAGRVVVSDAQRAKALGDEGKASLVLFNNVVQQRQAVCSLLVGAIGEQTIPLSTQLIFDPTANPADTISQRQALLLQQEAEIQYQLAHAERLPDVTLSVGSKKYRQTGDQVYLAGASIPLPVFNLNKLARVEAKSQLDHANYLFDVAQKRTVIELQNAKMQLQSNQNMLSTLDQTVIPAVQESLRIAQLAYQSGKTGLLEWVEARRAWRESSERRIEILLQIQRAIASIERETSLTTSPTSSTLEQ